MRVHKMTAWDEGQILIKAFDCLAECAHELKETQPEYSKKLDKMARTVGSLFNEHKSHKFGLPGLEQPRSDEGNE